MWGSVEQVNERFLGWFQQWESIRADLLIYTNGHPSEKIKNLADEVVGAVGQSFSATRYLSLQLPTSTMDDYHNAVARQTEAVVSAESLLEAIRRY
jgi:hypothetical protein